MNPRTQGALFQTFHYQRRVNFVTFVSKTIITITDAYFHLPFLGFAGLVLFW